MKEATHNYAYTCAPQKGRWREISCLSHLSPLMLYTAAVTEGSLLLIFKGRPEAAICFVWACGLLQLILWPVAVYVDPRSTYHFQIFQVFSFQMAFLIWNLSSSTCHPSSFLNYINCFLSVLQHARRVPDKVVGESMPSTSLAFLFPVGMFCSPRSNLIQKAFLDTFQVRALIRSLLKQLNSDFLYCVNLGNAS